MLDRAAGAIDILDAAGLSLFAVTGAAKAMAFGVGPAQAIILGALTGEVDGIIEKREYLPYYMHGTSHWLGLDVHDCGVYRTGGRTGPSTVLQPGMVLTVEPGLYFGPFAESSPERLKGIGVRIEDDVLVTADGNRVMTAKAPKSVAAVEKAVGKGF